MRKRKRKEGMRVVVTIAKRNKIRENALSCVACLLVCLLINDA